MCTVLIASRVLREAPLFIVANRDEFYDRPSDPPSRREPLGGTARWWGPLDRRAGGTWIGVNEFGLAAVITNRSDLRLATDPTFRSRGLLVRAVLESRSVEDALELIESNRAVPSAPYNLAFGDRSRLFVAWHDGAAHDVQELPAGTHVLSNFGAPGDRSVGEVQRALRDWEASRIREDDSWTAAEQLLGSDAESTGPQPLPGLAKDHGDRGTVSSTILALAADGGVRYHHAEGSPRSTPFRPVETQIP